MRDAWEDWAPWSVSADRRCRRYDDNARDVVEMAMPASVPVSADD